MGKSQQSFFEILKSIVQLKAPFAPLRLPLSTGSKLMNHKQLATSCMISAELFLKRYGPYLKNLYEVFLIKCLSLDLMIMKPLNVKEL